MATRERGLRATPAMGSGFSRLAGSVGLANLGDGIALVAWAWTASLLTRDPLWIAVLPAALRVPWVLFSLPAGILADTLDRRSLIVACDGVRAVAYAVGAGALFISLPLAPPAPQGLGAPGLYGTLVALGLLIGAAEVVRDNAAQPLLPALVAPRALERANGLLGSVETVGNAMAGPALGALLISLFLPAPFLVIALCLLCAAGLTASLKGAFRPEAGQSPGAGWRSELMACARFVFDHPMLRVLVLITGLWNFFAEMALIALVLHVQENLGLGATSYGLILALGAIGGVLGGALVAPFGRATSTHRDCPDDPEGCAHRGARRGDIGA